MGAQEAIQAMIDAQQRYDAIEYGRRALEWDGQRRLGRYVATQAEGRTYRVRDIDRGWIAAQIGAALDAAVWLGETDATEAAGIAWRLRKAKKLAAAELRAAKAAEKAIGTKRQLRLALAA